MKCVRQTSQNDRKKTEEKQQLKTYTRTMYMISMEIDKDWNTWNCKLKTKIETWNNDQHDEREE